MKRESWKIMLACALGAGIGSFISLEIASIYFIWVGLIVGGLVGYLAYDFKRVISVIPAAYRSARSWQAPPLFWRYLTALALHWAALITWIIPITVALVIWNIFPLAMLVLGSIFCGTILISLIIQEARDKTNLLPKLKKRFRYERDYEHQLRENTVALEKEISRLKYESRLFALPIVIFYHLPRGIWWLMKHAPLATRWVVKRISRAIVVSCCFIGSTTKELVLFIGRFGWQMFIRVHSQRRLICGTDAMIGAAIGYLAGSAIIGALSGALVGLVNYELVTRRWLIPKGHVRAPVSAKS